MDFNAAFPVANVANIDLPTPQEFQNILDSIPPDLWKKFWERFDEENEKSSMGEVTTFRPSLTQPPFPSQPDTRSQVFQSWSQPQYSWGQPQSRSQVPQSVPKTVTVANATIPFRISAGRIPIIPFAVKSAVKPFIDPFYNTYPSVQSEKIGSYNPPYFTPENIEVLKKAAEGDADSQLKAASMYLKIFVKVKPKDLMYLQSFFYWITAAAHHKHTKASEILAILYIFKSNSVAPDSPDFVECSLHVKKLRSSLYNSAILKNQFIDIIYELYFCESKDSAEACVSRLDAIAQNKLTFALRFLCHYYLRCPKPVNNRKAYEYLKMLDQKDKDLTSYGEIVHNKYKNYMKTSGNRSMNVEEFLDKADGIAYNNFIISSRTQSLEDYFVSLRKVIVEFCKSLLTEDILNASNHLELLNERLIQTVQLDFPSTYEGELNPPVSEVEFLAKELPQEVPNSFVLQLPDSL